MGLSIWSNPSIFLMKFFPNIKTLRPLRNLYSLRVLMLGKNFIKKIDGLDQMDKLDVLDIHGNHISRLDGFESLPNLRTLNLAGNQIRIVDNLHALTSLAELNLRRNNIEKVMNLHFLEDLKRLYLSFNSIVKWEDIWCISECPELSELSLDGNPMCSTINYRQTMIASGSKLKILDGRRTSEEERRNASQVLKKEIEKRKSEEKAQIRAERRKLAISNAARLWRSENPLHDENGTVSPDLGIYTGQVNVLDSGDSHLIECWPDSNVLRLFGTESLQYIEKAVGNNLAPTINSLFMRYGSGKALIERLGRIKSRLPNINSISFGECGLSKFKDFDKIHELNTLTHIHIESCNKVTKLQFWKDYLIQKIPSISSINGVLISALDIKRANTLFGSYFEMSQLDQRTPSDGKNRFGPM